jgi:hypothetical protein
MLVENEPQYGPARGTSLRRVSKGALIAALVGTLIVPATSAQAVPCPPADASQLTQGDISIEVRRLQKYGKAIRAEFRRRYGPNGSKRLNRFITRLANEASARSNADREAFCADASAVFAQAKAPGMTVSQMVTVPAKGTQLAAACDGTTTAGYRPVSTDGKSR